MAGANEVNQRQSLIVRTAGGLVLRIGPVLEGGWRTIARADRPMPHTEWRITGETISVGEGMRCIPKGGTLEDRLATRPVVSVDYSPLCVLSWSSFTQSLFLGSLTLFDLDAHTLYAFSSYWDICEAQLRDKEVGHFRSWGAKRAGAFCSSLLGILTQAQREGRLIGGVQGHDAYAIVNSLLTRNGHQPALPVEARHYRYEDARDAIEAANPNMRALWIAATKTDRYI